jgi:pre-mRNA-processing factor 6
LREFEHFKLCFSLTFLSEAQARRGEEPEIDPEQFQDPDNEYGLFASTTYEQDDEEADRVYEGVDHVDSRRRPLCFDGQSYPLILIITILDNHFREAQEKAEMLKLRTEMPKIQQQFSYLKRGLRCYRRGMDVGNRSAGAKKVLMLFKPDSILRAQTEFELA